MRYLKKIVINRPMLFLCGPFNDENNKKDRRNILAKYISNFESDLIKPFPIIVDNLFNDDEEIKKENLNIGLLEELVSNLAFKTYIFLDTMSTSYELGLFSNSKQQNKVSVLLEQNFKDRNNCYIGEYIKKSQNKNINLYDATIDDNNYIIFKDNELPNDIETIIFGDLKSINNINYPIKFEKGLSKEIETGIIRYEMNGEVINFQIDMRTLFYYLGYIKINKLNYDIDVEKMVKSEIIKTFICESQDYDVIRKIIFANYRINIFSYFYEMKEIIHHINYILDVMSKKFISNSKHTIRNAFDRTSFTVSYGFFDLSNAFRLFSISEKEKSLIYIYKKDPSYFVKNFNLIIHNKIRNIKTYKDNKNGKDLKNLHIKLNEFLKEMLPTSSGSFAYKENCNTLKCLKQHFNSNYFLKMDVKSFFESMSLEVLVNLFKKYLNNTINNFYQNYKIRLYRRFIMKEYRIIFSAMQMNRRFPIGFVTSPLISDFYLYSFDCYFLLSKYKYTRYADDIMFSSNEKINQDELINDVSNKLSEYKLNLNMDKLKKYSLKKVGDTVKFLGIIICKKECENVITISNKYIIETSKILEKYEHHKKDFELKEKCKGMCNYIKNIDYRALDKLKKIYKIKTGNDLPIKI